MAKPLSIEDLYTHAGVFDEQEVLNILHSRVVFTKDNEILFVIDPMKMKASEVVLLFALAKKVLKSHSKIDDEIITTTELMDKAKMKKSTVSVTIMRLKDKKLLLRSGSGYEIPMFKIKEVVALLLENKLE